MDFKEIEEKWQKIWSESKNLYKADNNSSKKKMYVLNEFPYPSGSGLHVGHAFSFTGGDVYARFLRMQGYNVLFPMGWDAFGLPTENYAIKMKKKPQQVTKENTDMFRSQMKKLAFSYDWSREVNTTDPSYYKWTQWIFIKLFEAGLAYKKEMPINWCPSCKIGLANEEVVDNKCERCHTEVSRRNISQWVVKITDYADRLIDGLKDTDFIEKVKMAQINWIGKSEGAKINFKLQTSNTKTRNLEVFTTRPDTLYGVTFMVISPEHELSLSLAKNNDEIKKYLIETRKKSEMERTDLNKDKTGVFSGLYAINAVNNKEIPIWISDFVLTSYGTGAIMSVPAHDERDKQFALKYNLPIISVYDENETTTNSGMWDGLNKKEAIKKATEWIKKEGIGEGASSYHLRDWIFSRQHYWGEPIPMVDCPKCGWVAEREENLPIVLPEVEAYEPTDDGLSPLSRIPEFVNCKCPVCGSDAKRETDTMPNWAGSDWYFLRYCDSHNDVEIADQNILKKWLPVDVYIGGDEHNTLHLLYSRFIHQFLYDLKVVPTPEPYYKRMSHGVILGPDNQRMSKSKGNVIVPESIVDKYGVDVLRMYLMFMGPFTGTMAWNENTLMGVKRYLDRFEKFVINHLNDNNASNSKVKLIINKLISGITLDLEVFGYNTVVAKLMGGLNELEGEILAKEDIEKLIKLIAPLAPYMAEELYSKFTSDSVHASSWPMIDGKLLVEETITIPVAVNGKVRSQLSITNYELRKEEILNMARENKNIKKWLDGKTIVNEIYVKDKMINYVIKG
jgi:leucyl-tRNA synthetase